MDHDVAIAPLLAPGEHVDERFAAAVLTERQAIVLTTRLGGGLRNPFTVQAAGFPYTDIQSVVVTSISALRQKNVQHLVELGTASMPAKGAPTQDARRAVKFSNGWSDPKAADDSYVEKPNVISAGFGDEGERQAAAIASAINARVAAARSGTPTAVVTPAHRGGTDAAVTTSVEKVGKAAGAFTRAVRTKLQSANTGEISSPRSTAAHVTDALRAGVDAARAAAKDASATAGETKICPDCAETVNAAARVCRFCGFRFDTPVAD